MLPATTGTNVIESKSQLLNQGEGKCILAASRSTQEAFGKNEGNHSVFTYYLLLGLKPNERSVDLNGNVTVDTLGTYIYDTIVNLPVDKTQKNTVLHICLESPGVFPRPLGTINQMACNS